MPHAMTAEIKRSYHELVKDRRVKVSFFPESSCALHFPVTLRIDRRSQVKQIRLCKARQILSLSAARVKKYLQIPMIVLNIIARSLWHVWLKLWPLQDSRGNFSPSSRRPKTYSCILSWPIPDVWHYYTRLV